MSSDVCRRDKTAVVVVVVMMVAARFTDTDKYRYVVGDVCEILVCVCVCRNESRLNQIELK